MKNNLLKQKAKKLIPCSTPFKLSPKNEIKNKAIRLDDYGGTILKISKEKGRP